MKVLQVNCVYRKGSTGKIVYDLHTELQNNQIESVVCYGRGEKLSGAYKTCSEWYAKANNLRSRITGLMYGGCYFSTRRLIGVIKKEKPDIVHLHCINGYFVNIYRLITWLKHSGIRTILTLHAELMHTANCGHSFECEGWKSGCRDCKRFKSETGSFFFNRTHSSWKRMKKAFDGFKQLKVVSVSPWLMNRAAVSPILGAFDHCAVLNGIDTQIFAPSDASELRERYAPNGEKLIFHATAAFFADPKHLKGGYYVLKLAERLKGEKVKLLVAAGIYDENIQWPENVVFLGNIRDQKLLARYYAAADVTLVTSRRETFSMPTAEALCCGTPVVGFEAGAPETIALQQYSSFVKYGDVDALEAAVRCFLYSSERVDTAQAHKKYSRECMATDYILLYRQMMEEPQ